MVFYSTDQSFLFFFFLIALGFLLFFCNFYSNLFSDFLYWSSSRCEVDFVRCIWLLHGVTGNEKMKSGNERNEGTKIHCIFLPKWHYLGNHYSDTPVLGWMQICVYGLCGKLETEIFYYFHFHYVSLSLFCSLLLYSILAKQIRKLFPKTHVDCAYTLT